MNQDQLQRLRIASEQKRRPRFALWMTLLVIAAATGTAIFLAVPRASDQIRSGMKSSRQTAMGKSDQVELDQTAHNRLPAGAPGSGAPTTANGGPTGSGRSSNAKTGTSLKAAGYIIARERIEISPRFMGIVTWMGVKKGDSVTNGQIVVRLDDSEYRARLAEMDGQLAVANVAVEKAKLDFRRAQELVERKVEMEKVLDDARLALATAQAQVKQLEGSRQVITTWMDWCTIRSPINGVVLEKLADTSELVTPQNFGGGRGPSTSLLAVADLTDLQVEVDLNESYLAQVSLGQPCRVSPEAYPDRHYDGLVAEIAPEASRQKGTLQVKVQILKPDHFLTPELSAAVEFLPRK